MQLQVYRPGEGDDAEAGFITVILRHDSEDSVSYKAFRIPEDIVPEKWEMYIPMMAESLHRAVSEQLFGVDYDSPGSLAIKLSKILAAKGILRKET
jgi:hypothetical protein